MIQTKPKHDKYYTVRCISILIELKFTNRPNFPHKNFTHTFDLRSFNWMNAIQFGNQSNAFNNFPSIFYRWISNLVWFFFLSVDFSLLSLVWYPAIVAVAFCFGILIWILYHFTCFSFDNSDNHHFDTTNRNWYTRWDNQFVIRIIYESVKFTRHAKFCICYVRLHPIRLIYAMHIP